MTREDHERWHYRWAELFNARDPRALADELMHPDVTFIDRRWSGGEPLVGPDAWVEMIEGLLRDAPKLLAEVEVLDCAGEIVLARDTYRGVGANAGETVESGAFELVMYVVAEHPGGRALRVEWFDEETVARQAFERLLGGLSHEQAKAMADRFERAVNERDLDALKDLYTEDFVQEEQRALAWETLRGPDAMLELWRSLFEFSPDLRCQVRVIGVEGNRFASQQVFSGTSKDPEAPWETKAGFVAEVSDGCFTRAVRYSDLEDDILLERLARAAG
jgi:ketosteroid isomerase-like protein